MKTNDRNGESTEDGITSDAILCDACGGYLVKSRTWMSMGFPYYLKPWGRILRMSEVIVPWLCPKCGRVYYLLENRKLVRKEWEDLPDDLKVEKILKPDILDDDIVGYKMMKKIRESFED